MAKQDVSVELFYGNAWHDLVESDDVLSGNPITITRGQGDESQAPRPSSINLTLNNDDDKFRTSNPISQLYGKAGVGTPLRVSVGGAIRGYGECSSWECDQSSDFRSSPLRGTAWTDVQAGGLLARINQWTRDIKSPLRQFDDSALTSNMIGRWPLEDKPGGQSPAGLVPGSTVTRGSEIAFGSQFRAPGTEPLVDIGGPSAGLAFNMASTPTASTAWQFSTIERLPALDAGAIPFLFDLTLANGTDIIVTFDKDNSEISFLVQTPTGTLLADAAATISGDLTPMRMWVLQFTQSGGNIVVNLLWRAVGDPTWLFISDSYVGTVTPLTKAAFFGGDLPEGTTVGHVTAIASATPDLSSDARYQAFAGYPQERTSYRFGRLCDANNIPYYVSAGFNDSKEMGPQGPDTLPGQFKEIQFTEDALIYDHRSERRVFMLSRADRYNQMPALTLDADSTSHGMPSLPREVTDNLPINNIVTASQVGGGDYTAEDSTSAMGSQDPPNGRGEFKQTVNVNVYDPPSDLPQQAGWWLNRGTVDRPRFPSLAIDLTQLSADQIAEVEAVEIGSVIEIVNFREYTVRLYVLGYTETIDTDTRIIVFTCAPDNVFNSGVLDTNRAAAAATALNADISASDTSFTLSITDQDEQWRTGNNSVPVLIGGELVTLGTVGAISGSGPWTQSVTGCARAVNGINKGHVAGDPVVVFGAIRAVMGVDA